MNEAMLRIARSGWRFVLIGETYALRHAIRGAGWFWDGERKQWWTRDIEAVSSLVEAKIAVDASGLITQSSNDNAQPLRVPEGKRYLPYQEEGIRFLLMNKRAILGDEMGLGKTIQAIGLLNNESSWGRALIICPASLRLSWRDALEQWLIDRDGRRIGIDDPGAEINITSYEMVVRCESAIRAQLWDVMICDECHYLKNPKSKRTIAVLGKQCSSPITPNRVILMSGTPMMNRPIELWPLLRCCDPEGLGKSWHQYVMRYCEAYRSRFGWVVDGASHLEELHDRLRGVMIRRRKDEVLKDLPQVTRQLVPLSAETLIHFVLEKEKDVLARVAKQRHVRDFRDWCFLMVNEYSKVRHDIALAKVPAAVELIQEWIVDGEPTVVMCHHTDVADMIGRAVNGIVVHGKMDDAERHDKVRRFQEGKGLVLVATMASCGTGLTMTRARRMVFAELDWVPATIRQAEARIHRIGQQHPVHYLYLAVPDSLEYRLAKSLARKENILGTALDDHAEGFLQDIFREMVHLDATETEPTEVG